MRHGKPQQGHEIEKARLKEARRLKLEEAFEALETALPEIVGASGREMEIATTHLQTAWLWAREALENDL